MFHVKHFRKVEAKNLTRLKTAAPLNLVRSIEFLVQFAVGRRGGLEGQNGWRKAPPV
jgi:hypothetical protein